MSHNLTEKEIEILRLISQGMKDSDIVEALALHIDSVHYYINKILKKLNSKSKTEAVINAIRYSILNIREC